MKNKKILLITMFVVLSCVTSTTVNNKTIDQDEIALQKQALKKRIQKRILGQNRIIDSLIKAKDPRLKKDKEGNYIRPNRVTPSGKPLYFIAYHGRSHRKAIKANILEPDGSLGYNLDGNGIKMGIWDGGHIFAAHDEFTGGPNYLGPSVDIEISDSATADIWSSHPTSVASVVVAKGLFHRDSYEMTGIAPGLDKIFSYNWENDVFEIFEQLQLNANSDFIISNHSYGYPLTDENNVPIPSEYIGDYSDWSALLDEIAYTYPTYLHVLAAGNDGRKSYPDQQVSGLDQLTGSTSAKNVLTVGSFSMDDNGSNKGITDFSSAGPTNDFRIKPEVCGPGENLGVASWSVNNPSATNLYQSNSGTSFASPAAAGGVALLQQLHKRIFNEYMDGAAVKALLCHTADDITEWNGQDITGPDVKTGYGAINLEKAAMLIQKDEKENLTIHNFELDQGDTETIYFQTTSVGELLTTTVSWYDPPSAFYATKTLINDLDLRVTQENTTYLPWKLPTDVIQPSAVLGDNDRDNIEKIVVLDEIGGHYKITISHKGILQRINEDGEFENTTQKGTLIASGPGFFTKSEQELNQFANVNSFLVTPIPAKESITISALDNSMPFKTLIIFDLSGRKIAIKTRSSFSLKSAVFDVFNIQSGVYVLGIETISKTLFKKIMIK
ncbi:MAG: hypothetical protein CMC82_00825 [Flavobacteriaceae bacterium]|nr:hypothetical protein [Flavobacteriaceae bacterium]